MPHKHCRTSDGQQGANRTIQRSNDSYNRDMTSNSARMHEAARNSSNGAIQAVAPWVDLRTGQSVMLPDAPPQGATFNSGGNTHVQGRDSAYHQRQVNGWMSMSPGR